MKAKKKPEKKSGFYVKVYTTSKEVLGVYNSFAETSKEVGISERVLKIALRNKTKKFSAVLKKDIMITTCLTK